jgi:DNA-binding transcriptional regulator GbsR (MarR family)
LNYKATRKVSRNGLLRRARSVQAKRSSHAKAIDSKLKAPRARSVTQWLSALNRYDLPTVDTNKRQKSMRVTEDYFWKNVENLGRLINKDDIEENNSANKKVVEQIMAALDKNNIPYYYGGEDTCVQVLKKDMERAEKLTNKLYSALKNTL